MPLQATSGAASYDAFGGVAAVPNYIEDVFSTWLYTGNGSTQTITNGIDLAGKGGLVWGKSRSSTIFHYLTDTNRGQNSLFSNDTSGQQSDPLIITSFNSNGFSTGNQNLNANGTPYVSWTFRKQPKFFDIVTYTGTGANRTIAHNLGSVPGCIIVKRTDTAADWQVYHGSLANTQYMVLNTTAAAATGATWWNSTTPTSTVFSLGTDTTVNASGGTYVAYLFAHNAGGFGLTGTDNVISCGSWTSTGSEVPVTLGYEPQWLLYKRASVSAGGWSITDNMRGTPTGSASALLLPNTAAAESVGTNITFSATGFSMSVGSAADVWIYIAIRRGPMKVPTDGTKVYYGYQPHSTGATIAVGFPSDFVLTKQYNGVSGWGAGDRLRGNDAYLIPNNTNAEASFANTWGFTQAQNSTNVNYNGANSISYFYRRAPGFFDEVCYTGTGANRTVTHNLGATPEMMLIKRRDTTVQWQFYFAGMGNTKSVQMPDNSKVTSIGLFNNTSPTSSVFTVGVNSSVNASGGTYVAYLAATCAGVSKVGTYTGTGATQTINCGFAGGARFVLIKNVGVNDYAYGYYVWDTARGMVSGTDPSLLLNSTAAEVNANSVYTTTGGFQIVSTAAGINGNGDQFVYWAIA